MKLLIMLSVFLALNLKNRDKFVFQLEDSIVKVHGYYTLLGGNGQVYYKPGYPFIPYYTYFVPVSRVKGEIKVKIITIDAIKLNGKVLPIPYFDKKTQLPSFYKLAKNLPSEIPGKLIDVKLTKVNRIEMLRIRIYPLQFNAKSSIISLIKTLKFELQGLEIGRIDGDNPYNELPFVVQNPQGRIVKKYNIFNLKRNIEQLLDSVLMIIGMPITERGIYRLNFEELGIEARFPINEIRLYSYGPDTLRSDIHYADSFMRIVPFKVYDNNGNGIFDEGDYIVFFAENSYTWRYLDGVLKPFHNPYTDTVYYWLAFGVEGEQFKYRSYDALRNTLLYRIVYHEKDIDNIAWKGLLWEGEEISRVAGQHEGIKVFELNLEELEQGKGKGIVRLVGGEPFTHKYVVKIADKEDTLLNTGYFIREIALEPYFSSSDQKLSIKLLPASENDIGQEDAIYLDYYYFLYPFNGRLTRANNEFFVFDTGLIYFTLSDTGYGVYNITDPIKPYLIQCSSNNGNFTCADSVSGYARYFVSMDYKKPIHFISRFGELYRKDYSNTDMLMITAKRFIPALWDYINYRSQHFPLYQDSVWIYSKGNIEAIAIEDIYRDFGFGSHDPVALRNFIKYVYDKDPELKFVYLIGDGHYDYREIKTKEGNIIPPYQPFESADINSLTEDLENFYYDMNGDNYPDLYAGRLPARTQEEILTYFDKVKRYETLNQFSPYRRRIMLVSDDEAGPEGGDGEAYWHVPLSEMLYANYTPKDAIKTIVYETDFGSPSNLSERGRLARQRFIEVFNQGNLIMSFYGHSNPTQLSHERLFTIDDVSSIDVEGKYPLCVVLTCKFGAFSRLEPSRVIAEDWVLNPEGAIGVIASPQATFASSNGVTGRRIFALALDGKIHPLGQVVMAGGDVNYILLGDPTIKFYYPLEQIEDTLTVIEDTVLKADKVNGKIRGRIDGKFYLSTIEAGTVKTYITAINHYTLRYHTSSMIYFNGILDKIGEVEFSHYLPYNAIEGKAYVSGIYSHEGLVYDVKDSFEISRSSASLQDTKGPEIEVFVNGKSVERSEVIQTGAEIHLKLKFFDEHGISLIGNEVEKGVYLLVDNQVYDLVPFFYYVENSSQEGEVNFTLASELGEHTLSVVAYDNAGNRSQFSFKITVSEVSYEKPDVMIVPNPLKGYSDLNILITLPYSAWVEYNIYTVAGTLIYKSLKRFFRNGSYVLTWNGKDMFGDYPGSGFYIIVINIEQEENEKNVRIKKGLFIERR